MQKFILSVPDEVTPSDIQKMFDTRHVYVYIEEIVGVNIPTERT